MKNKTKCAATPPERAAGGRGENPGRYLMYGVMIFWLIFGLSGSVSAWTSLGSGACSCSSCTDCEDALTDDGYCHTVVYLTTDITDHVGACIDDPYAFYNKIFDCQDFQTPIQPFAQGKLFLRPHQP